MRQRGGAGYAPASPCTAALRPSELISLKRGNAVAAKMPKITMTNTSSIRVKPD